MPRFNTPNQFADTINDDSLVRDGERQLCKETCRSLQIGTRLVVDEFFQCFFFVGEGCGLENFLRADKCSAGFCLRASIAITEVNEELCK